MLPYPAATGKSTCRRGREETIPNAEVKILRKERSGFRQKAPARKRRALTPSKRLKLSPAGPMVLHAKVCGSPAEGRTATSGALNLEGRGFFSTEGIRGEVVTEGASFG